MSKQYTKADLKEIAEELMEELRECEDGTITTTNQLIHEHGYTEIEEFSDLFDLHNELFKAARANHIRLDMSEHDGKVEGLPYNLTFVVRNKKGQIKCPYCGSTNTARYIYGYPLFSEEMEQKLQSGKWKLGGCCLESVEVDGTPMDIMPARYCNTCSKDFATASVLISKKDGTAEDYRKIVTGIKFSVGGFFEGHTDVSIKKNNVGAIVKVEKFLSVEAIEDKQITRKKWESIVNDLYSKLYLHEWEKSYVDPNVLDGTQWKLEINLTNGRKRHYSGSNAYPSYWGELKKIFRSYVKI